MTRKKPTAQLKLEGTHRPDRHGSDTVKPGLPDPAWPLSEKAQEYFSKVAELLHKNGLTTEIDATALTILAEAVEDYRTAREQVMKAGQLILSDKKTLYTNPAYHNMSSAEKRISRYAAKFGMTPVDRTGLTCGEDTEEDAFDALLKRSMN